MKGHFAYMSGYLICGGCGSSLSPYQPPTPIDNEYTYRVYCSWRECPNYLEVYEPTDKIKVGLIPTKLRAADPSLAMAGQFQARTNIQTRTNIGTVGVGIIAPPPMNADDITRQTRLLAGTPLLTPEEVRYPETRWEPALAPDGGLIRR